jgi:hypothetical protein
MHAWFLDPPRDIEGAGPDDGSARAAVMLAVTRRARGELDLALDDAVLALHRDCVAACRFGVSTRQAMVVHVIAYPLVRRFLRAHRDRW